MSVSYTHLVMIDHGGGFVTLYAHCSKLLVAEGQQVQAGDIIAEVTPLTVLLFLVWVMRLRWRVRSAVPTGS